MLISVKVALVGLLLAYLLGRFSVQTGNGLNIRRRYDGRSLNFVSIVFSVAVLLFLFVEYWNSVLNLVMGAMNPVSPVGTFVAVAVSGLAIALIATLYGIVMRGVGRIASALKIQRIYERRWHAHQTHEEVVDKEEDEVRTVVEATLQ